MCLQSLTFSSTTLAIAHKFKQHKKKLPSLSNIFISHKLCLPSLTDSKHTKSYHLSYILSMTNDSCIIISTKNNKNSKIASKRYNVIIPITSFLNSLSKKSKKSTDSWDSSPSLADLSGGAASTCVVPVPPALDWRDK